MSTLSVGVTIHYCFGGEIQQNLHGIHTNDIVTLTEDREGL